MWAGLTGRDPAHRPTGALASPGLLPESGVGRDLEAWGGGDAGSLLSPSSLAERLCCSSWDF